MAFSNTINLLPCHSLDDFPTHETGERASSLIANWTAAWHPGLIDSAGKIPAWHRVEEPPEDLAGHLVLVPSSAQDQLPTGFKKRAEEQGATIFVGESDRRSIIALICQLDKTLAQYDSDLCEEFFALGFGYLHIQLLTRQLRYSSSLDESYFQDKLTKAAESASAKRNDDARSFLQACHDLLAEERNRYFPVEPMLIDLLLVSDTTLGKGLTKQISRPHPVHLLISGELLERLAQHQPGIVDQFRQAVSQHDLIPVGGNQRELPSSMFSAESLRIDLLRGREVFKSQLDFVPDFYARRSAGLSAFFPQLLQAFQYKGSTHFSLDDGRVPVSSSSRIAWESAVDATLPADTGQPFDAGEDHSFLKLGIELGEAIDSAHWASATFAHWSDRSSASFDDLSRLHQYPTTLGSFVSWSQWLEKSNESGYADSFTADDYFEPVLKKHMLQKFACPISRWIQYWKHVYLDRSIQLLNSLNFLTGGKPDNDRRKEIERLDGWHQRLLDQPWEEHVGFPAGDSQSPVTDAAEQLAQKIPGNRESAQGRLIVNPFNYPRRCLIHANKNEGAFVANQAVYQTDSDHQGHWAVVDVSSGSYSWVEQSGQGSVQKSSSPGIVDENLLRNEFFEIQVDPVTGGIRSVHLYDQRSNLLSQQLSLRIASGRQARGNGYDYGAYGKMVADSVKATINNRVLGEIVSHGKILDGDEMVAEFQQTLRVVRGERTIRLKVEINPKRLPKNQPWESYYCSRMAWHDESATLHRAVNETRYSTQTQKLIAPNYLDIETPDFRISFLSGGIPYHQRVGQRMLDSLLIVSGEQQRSFEFGLAINAPDSMGAATSLLAPPIELTTEKKSPATAWLLRCEPRHLITIASEQADAKMIVNCLETQGQKGTAKISCARNIQSARRLNWLGDEIESIPVNEGVVEFPFAEHDYFPIELTF